MSTGKTQLLGLNQWELQDDVNHLEFNEDNAKIDAAVSSLWEALEGESERADAAVEAEAARVNSAMATETTRVNTALNGKQAKITASGMLKGNGSGGVSAAVAGTDYVLPSGSITGNAATATKATQLATARTIRTNLASTGTASFNGTANVTPGVTGTLPVANGGTGVTTLAALDTALKGVGAMKIETGSYTGTGVYGADNSNSLTFGFVPKMVVVVPNTYHNTATYGIIWNGQVGGSGNLFTSSGTTLNWYYTQTSATYGPTHQCNVSGTAYRYLAIG